MSGMAILTMILILGIIWGGFLVTLILALKKERLKARSNSEPPAD